MTRATSPPHPARVRAGAGPRFEPSSILADADQRLRWLALAVMIDYPDAEAALRELADHAHEKRTKTVFIPRRHKSRKGSTKP